MKPLYIRAYALVGFTELVEARQGDPFALLKSAGFSEKVLDDPNRLISWQDLCFLMELSAEKLNRPSFGLEWALSIPDHFPNVGSTVLVAQFVNDFREWIESSMRYWRSHTNAFTLHFFDDPDNDLVTFRYEVVSNTLPSRQQVEYSFGNNVRMARVVVSAADENPSLVRFQHPRPADTSLHDLIFRCPIEFDAPHNEFVFERRLLGYRTNGSLKHFKWLLDRYIRSRIARLPIYDQTMTAMVKSAIRSMLGSGLCSSEFVAHSLGMSNKKLQRLLSHEATSFSRILDDVRREAAIEMLSESDAPISQIACILDYSAIAPFTSAFRRWTGNSPRAYRNGVKRTSSPQLVQTASSPAGGT